MITGLRSDDGFRTNLGVVNGGDSWIGATVEAYGPEGGMIAQASITMPPKSHSQWSASSLFPALDAEKLGPFTVVVTSTAGPSIFAYGSVVDRVSGDPIYLAGR